MADSFGDSFREGARAAGGPATTTGAEVKSLKAECRRRRVQMRALRAQEAMAAPPTPGQMAAALASLNAADEKLSAALMRLNAEQRP